MITCKEGHELSEEAWGYCCPVCEFGISDKRYRAIKIINEVRLWLNSPRFLKQTGDISKEEIKSYFELVERIEVLMGNG